MDKRACIWVRIGWLAVAAVALVVVNRYVEQLRYVVVGNCALGVTNGPSALVYDALRADLFCVPIPAPDKAVLAPNIAPDDNKTPS